MVIESRMEPREVYYKVRGWKTQYGIENPEELQSDVVDIELKNDDRQEVNPQGWRWAAAAGVK